MQRSFIERVFPKPKKALLPQHDELRTYQDEPQPAIRGQDRTRSISNASNSRSSVRSHDTDPMLPSAPISASIIHHEDPFIAVDRAAQALQRTIQSLLDYQNESLGGRHQQEEDGMSQQGLTTTLSATTGSMRHSPTPGTTPIRQPAKKKTTLRGARRGIGKAMHDFAALKEEELKITQDEKTHRKTALEKVAHLEAKRESVQHEISSLQTRASGDESNGLRQEAQEVQNEIHELEGRIMELKAKHRHLSSRAEQIENSAASDLSSYKGALNLVDKEVRSFLRHPPVRQGLGPRNSQQRQDMYSLRPERRSLGLAKEQWTTELETLEQHGIETERERDALVEGARVWQETVHKIDEFEKALRARMKSSVSESSSVSDLVSSLDDAIDFLEQRQSQAETKDWKLIICAIGPELESFRQARLLLAPDEPANNEPSIHDPVHIDLVHTNGTGVSYDRHIEEEDADVPHADLLGEDSSSQFGTNHAATQHINSFHAATTSGTSSNESLKATLKNVAEGSPRPQASFTAAATSLGKLPERRDTRYSESEDDDPGPDFLVSR